MFLLLLPFNLFAVTNWNLNCDTYSESGLPSYVQDVLVSLDATPPFENDLNKICDMMSWHGTYTLKTQGGDVLYLLYSTSDSILLSLLI